MGRPKGSFNKNREPEKVEEVVINHEEEKGQGREGLLMLGQEHPPKRYTFKGWGILGTKFGTVDFGRKGIFNTGFPELAEILRKHKYEEVL